MVGLSFGQRSGRDELDLDEEKLLELRFMVGSSYVKEVARMSWI